MLNTIREGIGSWVVKLFLGLIIMSFAVWGVGDILRASSEPTVAEVGGTSITATEFGNEFRRVLNQLQYVNNQLITAEDARSLGLDLDILEEMIARESFRQDAQRLGLAVADMRVAAGIRENPSFQSEFGGFDRFAFENALSSLGLNEAAYVALERARLARSDLTATIGTAPPVPDTLFATLYRYRTEKREAELLVLDHALMGDVGTPSENDLITFYEDHPRLFEAPEYRHIQFLTLGPAELVGEISVSDEDLKAAYEDRIAAFTVEPTRDVRQMVFADENAAQAAYNRILAGADFAEVAEAELGLSEEDLSLGTVTKDALPAAIAEPAFALGAAEVGAPVESPFGWHLIEVLDATEGHVRSFDDVRPELRGELVRERARDAVYDVVVRIEDALAGGATLAEVARETGLDYTDVPALDAAGRTPDGSTIAALSSTPGLLELAFSMAEGQEPGLEEFGDDSYILLSVAAVIPPNVKPFAEVRDQVAEAWRAERRAEEAAEKAVALSARAEGGASLEALATEAGAERFFTGPMARDAVERPGAVSSELLARLFAMQEGEVVTAEAPGGGAHVVARLDSVIVRAGAPQGPEADRLRAELGQAFANDLIAQYRATIEKDLGVTANPSVIDLVLGLSTG